MCVCIDHVVLHVQSLVPLPVKTSTANSGADQKRRFVDFGEAFNQILHTDFRGHNLETVVEVTKDDGQGVGGRWQWQTLVDHDWWTE